MDILLELSYLFRTGVIGWQAEAHRSYAQFAGMHNLQQILIQVNSKNYRPKPVAGFEELFPIHADLARLSPKPKKTLADKWVGAGNTIGVHKCSTTSCGGPMYAKPL